MYKQGSQMHQSKSHEDLEQEYEENLSLLSINKQAYSLSVSSSNVADRSYQQYLLQPTEYQNVSPATSANVIFNTGNLNVNGPNSVLQCSISFSNVLEPNLCWSFGNNDPTGGQVQSGSSLASIVREALIQSRSGAMIQRNTYANVLAAAKAPFEKGVQQGFITAESGGASWMAEPSPFQNAGNNYGGFVYPVYSCSSEVFFELPLAKVLSFFGTNAPLCGVILSGAKLTLNFESMLTAFVFYQCTTPSNAGGSPPAGPFRLVNPLVVTPELVANPPAVPYGWPATVASPNLSYNVRNAQLMLDTTQIFDSSSALIMAAASSLESSGLQFPFWSTYQTRTTLNTSSNTIDIMISAAKLKTVIVVFRSQADINTGLKDSFARLPLVNYTGAADGTSIFVGGNSAVGQLGVDGSLRLRLGSSLNTLTPIRNAGQLYRQTYNALTTVKAASNVCDIDPVYSEGRDVAVGVSYSDWYYKTGSTTIAFDMSRSPVVSVSGGASNNSKAILLEIVNCGATVQNPIVADIFVEFLACLNSTTENSVLDS
jgi:hypothetical protein